MVMARLLPALAGVVFYAAFIARSGFRADGQLAFSLFDDGMVSMRYARNFADGHGLVWNPGQDPVEGYTNLLWTLWMSLLHLTAVPELQLSLLVMLTGAVLLVANTLVVGAIARRLVPGAEWAPPAAMLLTALHYPLAFWALRGMEVGLVTLVISLLILLALRIADEPRTRDVLLFAGVTAVGVLTRDDVAVPAAVLMVFAIAATEAAHRRRVAAALVAGLAVPLAAHTVFRLAYYGDLLPNTYFLKVGGAALGTRLSTGLGRFLDTEVIRLYAPLLVAAAGALALPRAIPRGVLATGAVFAAQCLYSVYVGGDAWEAAGFTNRYVTSVAPALIVLSVFGLNALLDAGPQALRRAQLAVGAAAAGLALYGWTEFTLNGSPARFAAALLGAAAAAGVVVAARHARGRAYPAIACVLLLGAVSGPALADWSLHNAFYVREDADQARYGLIVRDGTAPAASVAVTWAGAVPYFSHRRAVDLLGKSDRAIARGPHRLDRYGRFHPGHTKWDYSHSVGRLRPDLVAHLWQDTPADTALLERNGYRRLFAREATQLGLETIAPGRIWVRRDSRRVDPAGLSAGLVGHPVEAAVANGGH
jgi:arabinofuranosyltransferase